MSYSGDSPKPPTGIFSTSRFAVSFRPLRRTGVSLAGPAADWDSRLESDANFDTPPFFPQLAHAGHWQVLHDVVLRRLVHAVHRRRLLDVALPRPFVQTAHRRLHHIVANHATLTCQAPAISPRRHAPTTRPCRCTSTTTLSCRTPTSQFDDSSKPCIGSFFTLSLLRHQVHVGQRRLLPRSLL